QRRKPMDDKIIATFCLCDDLLKAMHHQENRQCQMNDAEILTTACTAALFFRGNHESARAMLKQHGYIPDMLSKSRFNRRLHRMKEICLAVFDLLAQTWKTLEIIRICGGGLRIRCYPREDLTHKRLSSGGKTGCYASWTSSKTLDGFWL